MSVNTSERSGELIPLPIVKLNRAVLLAGILASIVLQQPIFITLLFLIILPAVLFGRRASLIFIPGRTRERPARARN